MPCVPEDSSTTVVVPWLLLAFLNEGHELLSLPMHGCILYHF